jgi:hypothetical protein
MSKTLKETYNIIKNSKEPNIGIERFEIIKAVHDHKQFWKPKKVKTLLLAESHVYTSENIEIEYPEKFDFIPKNCPTRFAKLVYCLAYGENKLINIPKNSGTWQFWKILSSCASNTKSEIYNDFNKILKKTCGFEDRLKNKINILEKLKKKGVWLTDASAVGLYNFGKKPKPSMMKKIIHISWDNYILNIIKNENPKNIIIIGKSVENILKDRLDDLGINYESIYQPQAHISRKKHKKCFELCQRISSS